MPPEIAFDTGLGELFTVRVAGNVANTSTIASIEYAVAAIGTPLIVVLGHEACGAVTAAIAGGDQGHNLNHLLAHIEGAKAEADYREIDPVVRANAIRVGRDLVERSSTIRKAAEAGAVRIVPAYYALHDGSVTFLA